MRDVCFYLLISLVISWIWLPPKSSQYMKYSQIAQILLFLILQNVRYTDDDIMYNTCEDKTC